MKKTFLLIAILASSFITTDYLSAQENEGKVVKRQSMASRRKELREKKEKQKAEEAKAMEDLKKMHYENQDKKTQKRMKKAIKQANKNNTGKKGFSIRNWIAKRKRY